MSIQRVSFNDQGSEFKTWFSIHSLCVRIKRAQQRGFVSPWNTRVQRRTTVLPLVTQVNTKVSWDKKRWSVPGKPFPVNRVFHDGP